MRNILVLGAGRSSSSLIRYLLAHARELDATITVGDLSAAAAEHHVGGDSAGKAVYFDIADTTASRATIAASDVVVSLLPAALHPAVADLCLELRKHLLTASYVSEQMQSLDAAARDRDLLFLNECGLDPGIDHMSAMELLDRLKREGNTIHSFRSFTGGLIDPASDPDNPWRYRFTWNPRNVVVAGQGTARFLEGGVRRYVPYQRLFERLTRISVPDGGMFEGYVNRDSLGYIPLYGLEGVGTMVRGTLRHPGFCAAWNILVQLGCCDDSFSLGDTSGMTHEDFIRSFLPAGTGDAVSILCDYRGLDRRGEEVRLLGWAGLFSDEKVGIDTGSPAKVLETILSKRWQLVPGITDLVVMWHNVGYAGPGGRGRVEASLVVRGRQDGTTAMAETVGLPLGIAARLLMTGKLSSRGVAIPVSSEFYSPILQELRRYGVAMKEIVFNGGE